MMTQQDTVDRKEDAAIARYLAVRTAFAPCWGAQARVRLVRRRTPSRRAVDGNGRNPRTSAA